MVQRHVVVIPIDDGGIEVHPLKEWLRLHPKELPPGLDPLESTSHQLRGGLRKLGWTMQETPSEVRLLKPGTVAETDLVDEVIGAEPDDAEGMPFFSLEYQLRDFLASNLPSIQIISGKRLRLYVDPAGRDGVEYPTAVGRIDILAVDDTEAFYVFELKRANSSDKVLGQLARYMGWLRQTIGKEKQVFGIIVAKQINESLRYAASVVAGVHLFEYEVEFHLHPADELK